MQNTLSLWPKEEKRLILIYLHILSMFNRVRIAESQWTMIAMISNVLRTALHIVQRNAILAIRYRLCLGRKEIRTRRTDWKTKRVFIVEKFERVNLLVGEVDKSISSRSFNTQKSIEWRRWGGGEVWPVKRHWSTKIEERIFNVTMNNRLTTASG